MKTIKPRETEILLANPGMGWQTFHRTADRDAQLPDWLPSTVHYARWGWGVLEPEAGKLDEGFLEKQLAESRAAGQTLAFRVMCCSTSPGKPYHPGWLAEAGGRELRCTYGGREFPVPDLDDPIVLERHLDFLRRLGERFDGHRDLEHVDLGSVGWWGEWHMSGAKGAGMPTLENRRRIVEAYFTAFRNTPLLMLIGSGELLREGCGRGAGWRADCLGDMGGFSKTWCHMRKGYPGWIREAGVAEAWRRGPVAWESCWDMRKWVEEGWSLRFIFNYALAVHGSFLNNKSAPLPPGDEVRAEVTRFLRRLGYRFVLRELRHPGTLRPETPAEFVSLWQNVGSAPSYRSYRLAYRLTGADGGVHIVTGRVTSEGWMPGSVELFTDAFFEEPPDLPPGPVTEERETIRIPAELAEGPCSVAVALVTGDPPVPAVRLAIEGRSEDGWYPLSTCDVRR